MGLFGPSKESWVEVGSFPRYPGVSPCVVTPDGTGLIGITTDSGEGDIVERLRGRRTAIHRVTAAGLSTVYEGPGGIVAFDGVHDLRVAVRGTLKEAGEGSDYHLLLSTDGGWSFEERGPIPGLSVEHVLVRSEAEIWVLGVRTFGRTLDGGETWQAIDKAGDRSGLYERIRRDGRGVALVGNGTDTTTDGGATWRGEIERGGTSQIVDIGEDLALAKGDVHPWVGRRDGAWIESLSKLPADRYPLRMAVEGPVVRVLTRAADPRGGTGIQLFRSENGGRSFRRQKFWLSPIVDIAGANYGMGVNLRGEIHGRLSAEKDPCACFDGDARYTLFDSSDVGLDDWNGEVSVQVCRNCGRHWLRVYYVNEAFSKSGRWCRGVIPAEKAASLTPDEARPHLESLGRYLEGGSYFDGRTGWASGAIRL